MTFKEHMRYFFYAAFILAFTFPFIPTVNSPGLDASYMWAFNYFFNTGLHAGSDFIFTYGPLGFIKNPLPIGNNLEIAFTSIILLRLLFAFSILLTGKLVGNAGELFSFLLAFALSVFFKGIDFIIIGIVILHCLLYHRTGKNIFLFVVAAAGITGLFIKINIGVTSALIGISYITLNYLKSKNRTAVIKYIGFSLLYFALLWFIIYRDFHGITAYIRNTLLIASGNLGATSLNTPNNWLLLGTGFIVWWLFPVFNTNMNARMLFLITALAFFGYFRYSFAREENFHMLGLFHFMILLAGICFLIIRPELNIKKVMWLMLPLVFYNLNMHQSGAYHLNDSVEFMGVRNFRKQVLNFRTMKDESLRKSLEEISVSKLPGSWLKKIGSSTVDTYPWELSYIPANNLNYMPRPLIQLGCASSSSLDRMNAAFLRSSEAPEFIIWHQGWCSDRLCSIDERYLLNDDFFALYEILNHYKIVDSATSLILLQRNNADLFEIQTSDQKNNAEWNQWIACPAVDSSHLLYASVNAGKSWFGKIKSFLYKEHEYYIEYKLEDSRIMRHRFVTANSDDGVWISPYLFQLNTELTGSTVKEIRFIATDALSTLQKEVMVNWKFIKKISR